MYNDAFLVFAKRLLTFNHYLDYSMITYNGVSKITDSLYLCNLDAYVTSMNEIQTC